MGCVQGGRWCPVGWSGSIREQLSLFGVYQWARCVSSSVWCVKYREDQDAELTANNQDALLDMQIGFWGPLGYNLIPLGGA